jgi:hypothetical protein
VLILHTSKLFHVTVHTANPVTLGVPAKAGSFIFVTEIFHNSLLVIGTPGRIRTDTEEGLSLLPLPIGLQEHSEFSVCGVGFTGFITQD